ncbi:MAG: GNAT family N-acetyltransferase [Betaproteobacteria bacterium]|nr:GNAT family N-acetyltransferase [Betaproteobacteria bacterium]
MFTLLLGPWDELSEAARQVRTQVFIQEQGIPESEEWDDMDALCTQVVAYNSQGEPIATARLLPSQSGTAKIGRMAVLLAWRGQGIGALMLQRLVQTAHERGDQEAVLHAQSQAQGFYAAQGFETRGEVFDEVGMPHIVMRRLLF